MPLIPPRLKRGGCIGIASPSHLASKEDYGPIIAAIEARGFRVKTGTNLYAADYGYSATEKERAADFNQLVADPEVELVFFGGGDGGNELLPYVDFEAVAAHPKLYLSYSDGTTLLESIYTRCGIAVYYGQMPGLFPGISDYNYEQFESWMIRGGVQEHRPNSPWHCLSRGGRSSGTPTKGLAGGAVSGTLIGGYLENLLLLMSIGGFRIDPGRRYILFLEDHERFSSIEKLSALLAWLDETAFMDQVEGVLFGNYSDTLNPALLACLARLGERRHIPVAYCDDFGHGANHAILPIGLPAVFDAAAGRLSYPQD